VQLVHLDAFFIERLLERARDFVFLFPEHVKRLTVAVLDSCELLGLLLLQGVEIADKLLLKFSELVLLTLQISLQSF